VRAALSSYLLSLFIYSFAYLFVCFIIHLSVHLLIYPFIQISVVYSFAQPLIYPRDGDALLPRYGHCLRVRERGYPSDPAALASRLVEGVGSKGSV
jgi:hypothetical protein